MNQKHKKIAIILFLVTLFVVAGFMLFNKSQPATAGWFDDSWLYRKAIPVTNNTTAESNVYISATIDTSDTTKFQADCGDLRWTEYGGALLPYYIVSGCGTATTVVHINFETFPAGAQTIYYYYGNSSVANGFVSADFSTVATNYTVGTIGAEEKGPGPVAYWKFDEGFGQTANDSTINGNDGTLGLTSGVESSDPTWQTEDMCVSGKCLKFDGVDDYVDGGNGASLDITDAITIEAWVKPNETFSSELGEGYTVKYDADVFPESATPAWWKRGSDVSTLNNGILNMTDTKTDELNDYNRSLGMSRSTGATFTTRVRVNSANNSYCPTGFYIVDGTSWAIICFSTNTVAIDDGPGYPSYSVDNTEFQLYRITYKDGIMNIYLNENPTPIITETIDLAFGANNIQFGSSWAYSPTSNVDWDYVHYDLSGAYAPNDEADYQTKILSKGEDAYALEIRGGSVYGFVNDSYVSAAIDKRWHHIVQTYNGTTQKLYIDGILKDETALSGSVVTNANNINIGNYFNGFIDGVKIYPYARTAAQIKADYAARGTASGVSAALGGSASSTGGRASMSDGLVGYWKMDEASWSGVADEVVDASGAGNHGVRVADATTAAGKFGKGGTFDGTGDYVDAGNDASLDITEAITISAWVKAVALEDYDGIIMKTSSGNIDSGYGIFYLNSRVYFYVKSVQPPYNTDVYKAFTADSTWHHIVGTYDKSNVRIYVDGVAGTTKSFSDDITTNSNPFVVGRLCDTLAGYYFNGSIDEVRIYNRALSPGEVRGLYNWAPGPVGWWKMDEKVSGNGQTINDSSGYGNTGTTSSVNGTGMDCYVPGKIGSGCEFDGVDDYVNVGNEASLNIEGTNSFSFSIWVKQIGDGVSTYPRILYKERYVSGSDRGGWIVFLGNNGYLSFVVVNNASYPLSSMTISKNIWYHVVGTYDGTQQKLYVDGVLKDTDANTVGSGTHSSKSLTIGSTGGYTNTIIDDVRIYNYARTQAQILEDYSGGIGRKQPIGHWKFDEGYGVTANNSGIGGSALNGTLTTMASPATSTSGWTDSGKIGKALVFDGSDDYVNLGNDASLKVDVGSFGVWFKANPTQLIYGGRLVEIGDSPNRIGLHVWGEDNKLHLFSRVNDINEINIYSIENMNDDVWHYAVGTWNSSVAKLYIDGIEVSNVLGDKTLALSATPPGYIGRGDSNRYFNGSIDDVKIYNYALTEDEIREEYNQGALLKLGSTGTDSSGNADDSQSREYCIPGDTSACTPPVGRWDFNEGAGTTVNDSSGNNNTGTWAGTGSHWNPGKIGKAGSFNGSDDYVNAGSGSSLDITDAITVEAWVKKNQLIAPSWKRIIEKGYENSGGWRLREYSGQNSIAFEYYNGASKVSSGWFSLNADVWYHIVGTLDASACKLYVNGKLEKTGTGGSTASVPTQRLAIGSDYSANIFFDGSIDAVRIYNYARTPAQIAWDYNRGKPVAEWKFDECQGATAFDSSGNGNNGTITIGGTVPQTVLGTCQTPTDNTGAWYNGRVGKLNSSMSFDGVDDYASVADDDSLDLTSFTLGAWVKINQYKLSGIAGKGSPGPDTSGKNINYAIGIDASGYGGVAFEETDGTDHTLSTVSVLPLDTWVYFTGSYDYASGVFKVYINGTLDAQETEGSFQPELNTQMAGIANGTIDGVPTAGYYFNGLIDEVKIYNYALTAEQVKMEYNGGAVHFR